MDNLTVSTGILTYFLTEIPFEEEIVPFKDFEEYLITKFSLRAGSVTPEMVNRLVPDMRSLIALASPNSNSEFSCNAAGDLIFRGFQEHRMRARDLRQASERLAEAEKAVKIARKQLIKSQNSAT